MNHTTSHPTAPRSQPAEYPVDPIAEELRRYDEYLREVRGLAAGTREGRVRVVRRFLQERFAGRAVEIATLRPDQVRRFIDPHMPTCHSSSAAAAGDWASRSATGRPTASSTGCATASAGSIVAGMRLCVCTICAIPSLSGE